MKIADLMTTEIITVGPEASLKEAARRMIGAGVSGLLVTDEEGTLQGVITEADFVKEESNRRAKPRSRLMRWFSHEEPMPEKERLVEDVMTTDLVTLGPDADHAEAARLMQAKTVKRLPIVDENTRVLGILSRSDIMRAFARPDAHIIAEVRDHVMGKVLWIDPRRVEVRSVEGNVTLAGRLETKSDATLLTDMVKRVDGVTSVDSHLTWDVDNTKLEMVTPPPAGARRPNW